MQSNVKYRQIWLVWLWHDDRPHLLGIPPTLDTKRLKQSNLNSRTGLYRQSSVSAHFFTAWKWKPPQWGRFLSAQWVTCTSERTYGRRSKNKVLCVTNDLCLANRSVATLQSGNRVCSKQASTTCWKYVSLCNQVINAVVLCKLRNHIFF